MRAGVAVAVAVALAVLATAACGDPEAATSAGGDAAPVPWADLPAPEASAVYGDLPQYNDIEVELQEVPEQVKIGETARFVVALRNPTDRAVPLAPCPPYFMTFGESGTVVSYRGRLNCAAAPPEIGPGSVVRFEMELHITRLKHLIPGFQGTFFWRLSGAERPDADQSAVVTAV